MTTDRLVMAMLIKPGTPTLRISANSSQRGVIPQKFSPTIARERRYQIMRTLPPANGITSPQPAPAGPSAGKGPKPKISTGEMAMCTATQPISTEAHVAGAAHRIAQQIAHADDDGAAQRHVRV